MSFDLYEIWKVIDDFPNYEVSNLGNVRSNAKGKRFYILTQYDNEGYKAVYLYVNGREKQKAIHRLVAEAFIPNPENKPTVNHIDGNKANNCVDNLEWATLSEQQVHAFSNGLNYARKNEEANRAKLNWESVNYIRRNYPNISVEELSNKLNTTKENIYAILYNYNWKDENYKPLMKHHLSEDDVRYIRKHTEIPGYKIAKMLNISSATVSEIRNNKIWKGVM